MPSIYDSPFIQRARDDSGSVLWSDWLKQAGAGTVGDVAASVPAATRYAAEALPETQVGNYVAGFSHYLQDKLNEWGEDISGGLSPTAQRRVAAEFGSPEFWAHPFSSTALTAIRSSPSIAASAAMTLMTSGGAAGLAALMGTSGFLSAGETVDDMFAATDNQSDARLRETSPLYAGMREDGISEIQARKELNSTMLGLKPIMLGAFGGLTSLIGPEAQIVRALGKTGVKEAAKGGIAKRLGKATGEGFIGETAETGAEDYTTQLGAVDVGLQPSVDFGQTAKSALYGGVIGGVLGSVGGIKSDVKTKANPRPALPNPPAAVVANAVKPNQASVPARASNTQASPAIVPPTGTHTAPTSRAATIPGATPNQKKAKVAPNATNAVTTATTGATVTGTAKAAPATPATPAVAPKPAPQALQGDPTGLIAGTTEATALKTQIAPTGISGASTTPAPPAAPVSAPVPAPAPAVSTDITPAGNVPPPAPTPAPTPAVSAPAPTPVPQAPARTPAPGAGFGAGPEAAPVVQGRASNLAPNTVEVPTPTPTPAPEPAPIPTPAPAVPVHPSMRDVKPFARKDRKANEKVMSDHAIAQKLLDARPTNQPIPSTPEGVEALRSELDAAVKSAVKQGADLRKTVGHESTPHSLVWLREAQELVSYLNGKKPELPERLAAVTKFIDRENRIRKGEGVSVKQERLNEANAAKKKAPTAEQAELGDKSAKPVVGVAAPTVTKELTLKGGRKVRMEVAEAPTSAEPAEETSAEDLAKVSEAIVQQTKSQKKIADIKAKADAEQAAAREKGKAARAAIEARTAAKNIEIIKAKAAEAAKPKPLPVKVNEKVEAAKAKEEAKKPPTHIETRGKGTQYHGTSAVTLEPISEHYSTMNYYGAGFYTTDAADIAHGYSGKGKTGERNIYTVTEKHPLNILDGEQAVPADVRESLKELDDGSEGNGIILDALDGAPNIREFYDNIRDDGTNEGWSADSIQELFDTVNYHLRKLGYDGISHTGGLRTNKTPHRVVIYFNPEKDITIKKGTFEDFKILPPKVEAAKAVVEKRVKKPITVKATSEAVARAKAVAEATKVPPKPSSPAASSAEFAKQVKKEVEPNPSDAQIAAGNASKAHVNIEGMPLAIETAANTDRHIVKPDGGRISRLYKYAYGHILGTKSTDGQPIDIFLGPEAYPNNPKLEGLPVVIIEQVDPDTKLPDEPKVMYGFERVTDPIKGTGALEAYKDSYPRGAERVGDVVTMTPNEFKQWRISKQENKNAQEPAGVVVSELDALIMEQTEDAALDEEIDIPPETAARRMSMKDFLAGKLDTPRQAMNRRIEAYQARSAENEKVAAAFATRSDTVANFLDDSVEAVRSSHWLDNVSKALFPRFSKRIRELAGDVQVYVVPDDIFESQMGQPANYGAFYSMGKDYIVVRESEAQNDANFASLILHEATHAAFVKAVYSNPKMMSQLNRILSEAIVGSSWADVNAYGLTNIDELMAEAFSNVEFQEFLLNTKASEPLIKELGLDGKFKSLWDVLVRYVGKALGFGKAHDSLFSAVMKVSAKLELEVPNLQGPASKTAVKNYIQQRDADIGVYDQAFRISDAAKDLREALPSKVSRLLGSTTLSQEQLNSPKLMFLRTMDMLIQAAKGYGGQFYEHLRKIGDTIERIRTTAERYLNEAIPLIRESHSLERKYKGSGLWDRFVTLVMEETRVQVYADRDLALQKHLGKDTLKGAFPKAKWAELNTEWRALQAAAPDLMDFRSKSMKFYSDQQNKMKLGIIKNTLKISGFNDPDLAQRTFDGTETDADKAMLGEVFDHIRDTSELAKKEVYFPQMRRGDHVVRALYKIIPPTNALRQIDENTWEFAGKGARKRAMAYAASQDHLTPNISSVWVDTNTGERFFNLGQPDEVRVRPTDTDAEQRFRVTVDNRFVEFYESKREAHQVAEELKSNPDVEPASVAPVVEKRFNPGDRHADLMSYQMRTLASSLERRPGFQNLSAQQQNQVVQAFNVASLRILSSTRIQSRRQPRTNVLGASRDFTRNMLEYSQSVSGYLSRLDHQDDLDTAMKAAREEADSHSDYNKSGGQSTIMNQVEERVARATAFEASGRFQEWASRLLGVSFASKLISPAYNILNSLQVAMVSYPALAARFGAGRAAMMLFRTYREIGTGTVLKQGLTASKRALVSGPEATMPSIVEDIISRIKSPQVRAMLKHLIEVGSIDANAGIEIADMIETRTGGMGALDNGLNYLGTFGRQMPKAIEAINRTVTAIASYNLEMQRSGDHDTAVRFAQETTNMTQGLYSHSNAAPIFNHPLGKLSLQFKKFGQLMYGLLGHNIGKAIRNAEPGDRAEAVKTLAYMAATHFVMAGALGLPQEPLKWMIIAARQAGADISWADVENYERELLSSALGQQLGEIAARGVTRALPAGFAFDLSSRVGMQDLLTFGEPRSADKQDLSAFLWDTVGGAPAGLVGDWIKGTQAVMKGDIGEAAQRFSPIKLVTDAIKSYRNTSGGQKTAAGYEKLSAYGIGETAVRAFGFTPAREAETTEARNYYAGATQAASAARTSLMQDWYQATPSARGRMWGQVEKFNYGKTRDEKLTRSELDKYSKRRRTEERSGLVKSGFRVTRREAATYKKLQGTYNINP